MENWKSYFLGIYIVTTIIQTGNVFAILCSRYPQNTLAPKAPVDDNFAITITGNAQTYLLGQTYNGKYDEAIISTCCKLDAF